MFFVCLLVFFVVVVYLTDLAQELLQVTRLKRQVADDTGAGAVDERQHVVVVGAGDAALGVVEGVGQEQDVAEIQNGSRG